MKLSTDSDINPNPTMLASNVFEAIIDKIRYSNLNFQIQMSPFSAIVSLKKSFITNKSGIPLLPPPDMLALNGLPMSNLQADNAVLAAKNLQLEKDYARVVIERNEAHERITSLELELNKCLIKEEEDDTTQSCLKDTLEHEVDKLKTENTYYRDTVKVHLEEICDLENSLKVKVDIVNQLNKKFSEFKKKTEKENASTIKSLKTEIKSWRKELGEERKEKLKLEEKLEKSLAEKRKSEKIVTPEHIVRSEPIDMAITMIKHDHSTPTTANPNDLSTSDKEYENIELEEKEDGFIGPRLPRLMTDEEFNTFCQKLLGNKHG